MPAIGYVNKLDDGSYRGTLRTLTISTALKIMPNKDKKPESEQPEFRVYANGAEIVFRPFNCGELSTLDFAPSPGSWSFPRSSAS